MDITEVPYKIKKMFAFLSEPNISVSDASSPTNPLIPTCSKECAHQLNVCLENNSSKFQVTIGLHIRVVWVVIDLVSSQGGLM